MEDILGYRKLDQSEINILNSNGCTATNWKLINVHQNFSPANIRNVAFSGEIFIGIQHGEFDLFPGIKQQYGIYNSSIHNCKIGDKAFIKNVQMLMNYDIEENVIIINTDKIALYGESTFGNGTEIEVLNEGGGRELKIYDKLSSQIAYMLVTYRHAPNFINSLKSHIENYIDSVKSTKGSIGKNTRIENCKQIQSINIGQSAHLYAVLNLNNGTIASTAEAPVTVGEGVIANNFIIQSGSIVDSSAILNNCFIGQSVKIGKQFSAENSAFFANCEGFHGETCSVFAGPYTVTHHKSTLLIAGMYSFYNAGSGTNQSNHMYKLGPVHQGIMERGSKTGSFSYLLWPSRIGAFSVVVGKHYANFDTSLLPFSYIVESGGKSTISPAMNLFTVGTRRDSQKWKKRDKRKDSVKYDLIHFTLFNPYIIDKVVKGMDILKTLYEKADKTQDFVMYNGINIKRLMLKSCRNYYDMPLNIYIGDVIIKKLKNMGDSISFENLKQEISNTTTNQDDWVDISGMLAPKQEIEKLMAEVTNNTLKTVADVANRMQDLFDRYDDFAFPWTLGLIENTFNIKIADLTQEHLIQIIENWQKNSIKLNNMIINDANKEFDSKSHIGFGIDGDSETANNDFNSVRGQFADNSFIIELKNDIEDIGRVASEMFSVLKPDV